MRKLSLFIILFLLNSMKSSPAQNFQLKNIGNEPIWFSLGDKDHDPANNPNFTKLEPQQIVEYSVPMQNYPEIATAILKPSSGDTIYYYMLSRYKAKDIFKKKMFLTIKKERSPSNIFYPLVVPDPKSGSNNILPSELESMTALYKREVIVDITENAYKFLDQLYQNKYYRPEKKLNQYSNSYDILGITMSATREEIDQAVKNVERDISYLQQHPDTIKLHDEILYIVHNAYRKIR